jgi:hypothetical protein
MSDAYGSDLTLGDLKRVNQEARAAIDAERASGFRTNRFLRRDYGGESITQQPTGGGGAPPQQKAPLADRLNQALGQ